MRSGSVTVYLARHGRTAYNHQRRFQGHLPVALDKLGKQQARDLARAARALQPAALWSSPLLRARETAAVVAAELGLTVREDPRLAETATGHWTDLSFAEVENRWPERFARFLNLDPQFAFPGGESFAGQEARVKQVLLEIAVGPSPALVICHGVVIRLAHRAFGKEPPARIENGVLIPLPLCPPARGAAGSPQRPGGEASNPRLR